MNQIFQMAIKDIRLIARDRLALFFIVGFPIMMGLFFGSIMSGGGSSGSGKLKIAIVDQDQSEISKAFVDSLMKNDQITVDAMDESEGKESVRKGSRVAIVILPLGFGKTAGVFWNDPPRIDIGVDPSRQAESGMLEGFIMQSIGELVGQRFQNPMQMRPFLEESKKNLAESDLDPVQRSLWGAFLGSVDSMLQNMDEVQKNQGDSQGSLSGGMKFADVHRIDVTRQLEPGSRAALTAKIRSGWDISFPQAMLWGVLSCVAGFAISIARERTLGTLVRLQVAPVTKFSILAGKALACFLTVMAVVGLLVAVGVGLGLNPESYLKLSVAAVCLAVCFVGLMMVISVIAKTEQGVSGAAWGINMIMAMVGGCMIPAVFLPGFLQKLSVLSPVRWGIEALEGAIWRQYSWWEMAVPCTILVVVGLVGTAIGGSIMRKE